MQNALKIAMVAGALGLAAQAQAVTFDLQVSDSNGLWGNGQVTASELTSGIYLVTSGSLQLSGGPYTFFDGSLVQNPNANGSLFTAVVYGGTHFDGVDDIIVQSGSSAFVLSDNGIVFNDSSYSTGGGNGLAIALWANGPGPGNDGAVFNGFNDTPYWDAFNDGLTVTVSELPVPDGGLTAGLLGGALIGLGALRRKLQF